MKSTEAHLYLNDKPVGAIAASHADNSWTFGEFTPSDSFTEFAPLFGQWSLLVHADDDDAPLSTAAAEELRSTEQALHRINARIFIPATGEWRELAAVNIDGSMIEWKEV